MARDSSYTFVHYHSSKLADLLEEFSRPTLAPEDIFVPPAHQPPNPEDEDDVVPDQHAAFGIQRATQPRREPAWRDLGLRSLLAAHHGAGGAGDDGSGAGAGGEGVGGVRNGAGSGAEAVAGAGGSAGVPPQMARPGLGRSAGHAGGGVGGVGEGRGGRRLPR